ncbi:MAG: phytanoyl-CoA dioxygenase family protein [Acidimicrobiia bacterium]
MTQRAMDGGSLERILSEVTRLGLTEHVAELETRGCTIVPPERLVPAVPVDEMFERILNLMEQRNGMRPDVRSGGTHINISFPTLYYFLFEDPMFEEWLLHPVVRCLVDALLGERCILHATAVFMKGPSDPPEKRLQLGLHTDQQAVPDPMPAYPLIAGATLLLTDYTREEGAFAYVPGSHARCRHPAGFEDAEKAVPIEASRGSLLVHDGRLWHGSFGRTKPGLRAGMAFAYSRMFMAPLEAFRENVTKDTLDRYPERFASLLSQHVPTGSTEEGPDLAKVGYGVVRTRWD